jgi:signal transduction histidine kinase
MVTGESGVLVLIVLLSSIFLYRFIKLEKRTAKEVETFWGRATHEIKTPITGVKAFLQSLKNESIEPAQLPHFVDMALKQVEKQEQLAENILAGYGLRPGKSTYVLHLESLGLGRCVRDYFDAHAMRLTGAELRLPPQEPGKDMVVQVDSRFFRVILDNIVDNAQKYCSPGLILELRIFKRDRQAVLAIKDNGPGFQPGMAEKIFCAFKYPEAQLPATAHGSGMGLYISRQLAEQMGGRLTASSEGKGQGAEFQLSLTLSRK